MRLIIFQYEGKYFLDRYVVVYKSGHSKTLCFSTLKKKKSFVEFLTWQINIKTVTIMFCPWFKSIGRKFQICKNVTMFLGKVSNFCQFQVNWVMSHLSCASSVFCHLVPITRLSFKSYRSKIALWHYMVRSLLAKLAVSPTMPLDVSVLKQDLKIWPILGSFPCHNCEKLHL